MIFFLLFLPTMIAAKGLVPPPVPAGWEEVAKRLHASMNEKVKPCDDFYEFACGNWKKAHHRPPSEDYWNALRANGWDILKNISYELKTMDPKKQIRSVQQLKIYYDHCMKGSAEPNKDFLRKMLHSYGKWPIIDQNWKGSVGGTKFKNTSALIGHLMGTFAHLPTFMVGSTVPKNPQLNKTILEITATPPGIETSTTLDQLKKNIMDVAIDLTTQQLDVQMLQDNATTLAKLLLKLQKNVQTDCVHKSYLSVSDIQKRWQYFNWTVLLTRFAEKNTEPKTILDNKIYICNPKGLENFTKIIKEVPDVVIQSYVLWQLLFVSKQLTFEPEQSLHYSDELHTERLGKNASLDIKCAKMANQQLPMVTGHMYVVQWQRGMPTNIISTVRGMTSFIFAAFRGMLNRLDWLDANSTSGAFEKLDYLIRIIGYNDDILKDAVLDKLHTGLHLNKDDDPFVTLVHMNQFQAWSMFRTIGQKFDRGQMLTPVALSNAAYVPNRNRMEISAGIINLPFFQAGRPLAVNYGSMGAVLGHELTHGFAASGLLYDAFGNSNPWMSDASFKKYWNMSKCVEKQYDHYCYPNVNKTLCVNGEQTLTENIADAGGVMAAYKAYKDKVKLSGKEPRLPKPMQEYDMDMVFFISFGQTWCNSHNAAGLIHEMRTNDHAPGTTRVNGTLQNIPEFAKAFNCTKGSKMAPKDHCNVWVNKPLPKR